MPMATEIVIGVKHRCDDPAGANAKLFEMVEAKEADWVVRTIGESHEFDLAVRCEKGEIEEPDEEYGYEGKDVRAADVPSLHVDGTTLFMYVSASCVLDRIDESIKAEIDPVVRGPFSLNSIYLAIGGQDVFQVDFVDEPTLLGRYFLSVTFEAWGLPEDADAVLEGILALEEFRAFRAQFESEFGPSEVVMILIG